MVDLGSEENFGGYKRVFLRQEEFQSEKSALVWRVSWSSNFNIEMSGVGLIGLSVNSDN